MLTTLRSRDYLAWFTKDFVKSKVTQVKQLGLRNKTKILNMTLPLSTSPSSSLGFPQQIHKIPFGWPFHLLKTKSSSSLRAFTYLIPLPRNNLTTSLHPINSY